MPEQLQHDVLRPVIPKSALKVRALLASRTILDAIVTVMIFAVLLTLIGATAGLIFDFWAAASAFSDVVSTHTFAHGVVDGIVREVVVDVLSIFVLIELFRAFSYYLKFDRIRLWALAEVGIVFILREIFIGLYEHRIDWTEILALAAFMAVLVATRIAAVHFEPRGDARA